MLARTESMPLPALRDLLALTKPRLSALVMLTCGGGLLLAPGSVSPLRAVAALLGSAFVVGAANTLNCYLERDLDRLMLRTRERPLPAGRMEAGTALWLAALLATVGLALLQLLVNPLTTALAAVALVSYVAVYTPMKQRSPLSLWVGAVPGALPPLMGWTAARGQLELGGLALFALLFFWQLPHFVAIGVLGREDYARAGYRVLSVVGSRHAQRWHALGWSLPLPLLPLALVALGLTHPAAGILGAGLGLWLLAAAWSALTEDGELAWARVLFRRSLSYLSLTFLALCLGALVPHAAR